MAVDEAIGIKIEFDVRIDTVPFDDPILTFRIPATELRLSDHAAITQWFIAADPNPAAPGPRADHRAEFEILEPEREGFAIAAALTVDQARHVSVERVRWNSIHATVTRAANGQDFSVEMRQEH